LKKLECSQISKLLPFNIIWSSTFGKIILGPHFVQNSRPSQKTASLFKILWKSNEKQKFDQKPKFWSKFYEHSWTKKNTILWNFYNLPIIQELRGDEKSNIFENYFLKECSWNNCKNCEIFGTDGNKKIK